MKMIQQVFLILCIASVLSACKGDDPAPLTEEQQTLKNLAKTWNLTSASVDGEDVTEWFQDLSVSYTEENSFTVQNAVPPIWVSNGTFELEKSVTSYVIKRNDGIDMTVTALGETNVTVSFTYTAPVNARVKSISGVYTFSFQAQ